MPTKPNALDFASISTVSEEKQRRPSVDTETSFVFSIGQTWRWRQLGEDNQIAELPETD